MKTYYITVLFLVLLLCGCQRRPAPLYPALQKAEGLMQEHPDSALAILSHYSSKSFSDSADIAAYALLRTKADDKNYINHTSDALISIAVKYYDRYGSDLQKAEAHYYMGRTFQDRSDDVHTAEQFIKAAFYCEVEHGSQLSCKIKSNLAYLLWEEGLFDASDSIYRQLLPMMVNQCDIEGVSICYLKLGEMAMQIDKPDLKVSECYLKRALYYAMKINNVNLHQNILYSLSILYNNLKNTNQAIYYGKKSLLLSESPIQRAGSSLSIGISYFQQNKNDSALNYLTKSITTIGNDINEQACRILATIYKEQGNQKNYVYYNDKIIQYKDSLAKEKRPADIVTSIYKLMSEQNDRQYSISNMVLSFALTIPICYILLFILYLYCRVKRKQNKMLYQRHIEALVNKRQIDIFIENEVKEQLASRSRPSLKEQISSSAIFSKLISICSYNENVVDKEEKRQLAETDWNDLEKEILRYLPNFVYQLESHYDLSKKDIHLCFLIRLEFSNKDIAEIFAITPQAIDYRKKMLRKKMNCRSDEVVKDIIFDI